MASVSRLTQVKDEGVEATYRKVSLSIAGSPAAVDLFDDWEPRHEKA